MSDETDLSAGRRRYRTVTIHDIRGAVPNEEIDYTVLSSLLAPYGNVRDKIGRFLRAGELIRIKKGLYIFGPTVAREPYSREVLANLIYGPSVISLEYALSRYGMIPERVDTVTSVTTSRNKLFTTPAGVFSYTHQHSSLYTEGASLVKLDDRRRVLMANREKALADQLTLSSKPRDVHDEHALAAFLSDDLRLDLENLATLNLARLRRIERTSPGSIIALLRSLVEKLKEHNHA